MPPVLLLYCIIVLYCMIALASYYYFVSINNLAIQRSEICRLHAEATKWPWKENWLCNTTSFQSRKISEDLKAKETKPSLVNQQSIVYEFQCNSCDSNYRVFTSRHLHLRIEELKYSVIGKT